MQNSEHSVLHGLVHPIYKYFNQGISVSSTKLNSVWGNEIKKDPELKQLAVCIKVIFSSDKEINISTKYVLSKESGPTEKEHIFMPLIDGDISIKESISLNGGMSGSRSISLSIPNKYVDAEGLIKKGRFIAGVGEVSFMYNGINYEDRLVIMRGSIDSGVKFDTKNGGSVSFSISDPKSTLDNVIPSMVVTPSALNNPRYDAIGSTFPLVIGNGYPYVPIVFYQFSTSHVEAAIAIGHQWTVTNIYRDGTETSFYIDIQQGVLDGSGGAYDIVKGSLFGVPVTKLVGRNLTVGWPDLEGSSIYAGISINKNSVKGTGLSNNFYPDTVIDTIKHIITNFTHTGITGINEESFSNSSKTLSDLKVRCLINSTDASSRTTALDYIGSEICSSFPMISVCFTSGGLAVFVIDKRKETVRNLVLGGTYIYDRSSEIEESPKSSLYNSFVYKYSFNALDNTYEGCVARSPHNSTLCLLSRDFIGDRSYSVIQSNIVFDDSTANYIIDWLVSHHASPSYRVSYSCVMSLTFMVSLGDNIKLTDEDMGWDEITATIIGISYEKGYIELDLIVWSEFEKHGGSSMDSRMSVAYRQGSRLY